MDTRYAYVLFKMHGIKPSEYYNATIGERIVYRAFIRQQIEDEIEENKEIMEGLDVE